MDSLQNIVDTVYCQNGYMADNHDFMALSNGNYVLISYDEQPYAMDTIVTGGDSNAIVEGLIIQELDPNHNVIFEWKSGKAHKMKLQCFVNYFNKKRPRGRLEP